MKLSKDTPANVIKIRFPMWNAGKRVIGIAAHKVGNHNQIEIEYTRKSDGERIYPMTGIVTGKQIGRAHV